MKLNKYIIAMLMIGFTFACKKEKKNPVDTCGIPELKATASVDISNPCGIAVSPAGRVAITQYKEPYGSAGTTKIWNSYSDLLSKKAPSYSFQNTGAEAVAFDKNENLYVAETEGVAGIAVYKAGNYQFVKTIQAGFVNPRGIAFDSQNRMYLADDGNDRLLRFDNPFTSNDFKVVAAVFGNLKGLAIANDVMCITGYNRNILYKYVLTAEGALGTSSRVAINKPVDVAAYQNTVAVATPDNGTTTLFNADQMTSAEANYAGCKKELKATAPVYGLAFVKTSDGYGLLSAQYAQNKVVFYEP